MKNILIPFIALSSLILIFLSYSKPTYTERSKEFNTPNEIAGSIDYFKKIKANQITGRIDLADVENARNQIQTVNASRLVASVNLSWDEMGPDNVAGRTRALMLDKDSILVMYAGGVAGGLWKSWDGGVNWRVLFDTYESNTISCITQASNGDIYVGTGEGHYSGNGTGSAGMIGSGIYKSTDRGASWSRLSSTIPTSNTSNEAFSFVNELATKPGNPQRVYASTNKGLRMSDDGGQTWINPIHTANANSECGDVKVGSDGTVITSLSGNAFLSLNGNDSTFTLLSTGVSGKLPNSNVSRIEFAFSPQNSNYIYASLAANSDGGLLGLYQTKNKGQSWLNIAVGNVDPLAPQGSYDNAIVVSAQNKEKIFVGGTTLYSCLANATPVPLWTRMSVQYPGSQDEYRYVHPDIHVLISDPTSSQVLYIGNDGGIFKTTNLQTSDAGGPSFSNLNHGYNVTQYYAISPTANGGVVGGTQDNGSNYINYQGGTTKNASKIGGGDGGYTEASFIFPSVFFSTIYYGSLRRSFDSGNSGTSFYSDRISVLPGIYDPGFASFITPIALFESFNDRIRTDSVNYVVKATDNTAIGGILSVKSRVAGLNSQYKKYFNDTNKVVRTVGETIRVRDILQSHIAVGFNNSVWLSKHALDESGPISWMRIGYDGAPAGTGKFTGTAKVLRFSKDGDYLYVGTFDGGLYRFSNLKSIQYDDTLTGEIGDPNCFIECKKIATYSSRAVCGIAIDPNNNDKLVVTLGNYGNSNYVYLSNNATTLATFTNIQNNLPAMPVYDAVIDMNNSNNIVIGTEYGVWASDDNGTTWSQSGDFPKVPVLCLRQQIYDPSATVSNTGSIFAGTHGRGAFITNSLVGIKNNSPIKSKSALSIVVSPNPVKDIANVDFYNENSGTASIKIFSLQGKLMQKFELENLNKGKNKYQFSVQDFEAGTYLVSVISDNKQYSSKFVVIK